MSEIEPINRSNLTPFERADEAGFRKPEGRDLSEKSGIGEGEEGLSGEQMDSFARLVERLTGKHPLLLAPSVVMLFGKGAECFAAASIIIRGLSQNE